MQTIHVGDLAIQPLYDGTAVLSTDSWAGSDWTEHQHLIGDDGQITVPVGAFLVRVGDKLLMLDAGVGAVQTSMFDGGRMLDSLAAAGVTPEEIDVIVISHMHPDHNGWLVSNDASTFPRASIRVGAADWEHFVVNEHGGAKRAARMRLIENQLDLIDCDGTVVLPGVTTRATPGHTPGHISAVISSGNERLIVLGDSLHCPAPLTETEWQFIYDVDADLAVRTRKELVREADEPGTQLLPCHFPGMQAARLVPATGNRRWVIGG